MNLCILSRAKHFGHKQPCPLQLTRPQAKFCPCKAYRCAGYNGAEKPVYVDARTFPSMPDGQPVQNPEGLAHWIRGQAKKESE